MPKVFELVRGLHFWAGNGRAEFSDGAIEKVELVVEINN